MQKKAYAVRFILLKVLHYGIITSYSSFALSYLKANRCSGDSQASLLLMLYAIGAFAGQFFFGRLCDYFHTHKKVFFLVCGLAVPIGFLLFYCPDIRLTYVLYLLFGFCLMPMSVIVDTWFLDAFPGDSSLYGKMLAGGAITYAVLGVTYGKILDAVGYGIMPWCMAGLVLLALLLAFTIPDASGVEIVRHAERGSMEGLFRGPIALFLTTLMFTGICGNTYSLIPVLMVKVNGSLGLLGLSMSSSGIAQIPFMLLGGKLKRIPARLRVAISGTIYFIMVLCFAFGNTPWYLIFGALISGAAWGILLPAYRELVSELAPAQLRTTAQGMADAIYFSLGGVLSSGIVSLTSGSFGMRMPLVGISFIQIAAILILLITNHRGQTRKSEA